MHSSREFSAVKARPLGTWCSGYVIALLSLMERRPIAYLSSFR